MRLERKNDRRNGSRLLCAFGLAARTGKEPQKKSDRQMLFGHFRIIFTVFDFYNDLGSIELQTRRYH